jgi:hypothetical protein
MLDKENPKVRNTKHSVSVEFKMTQRILNMQIRESTLCTRTDSCDVQQHKLRLRPLCNPGRY